MSSASSSLPETVLCCSCRQKCYPTSQWSSGWRWPTLVPDRCFCHTATCTCPDSKSSLVSLWEQLSPDFFFFKFHPLWLFPVLQRDNPGRASPCQGCFLTQSPTIHLCTQRQLFCTHATTAILQHRLTLLCRISSQIQQGCVLPVQSSSSETLAALVLSRFLRRCRLPAPSALPVCSRCLPGAR